jgi:hypothetical protein
MTITRFPAKFDEWVAFCATLQNGAVPATPNAISEAEYRALTQQGRDEYDARRAEHHNHLGPYEYAPIVDARARIEEFLQWNAGVDIHRMPFQVLLDAPPGSGKSTLALRVGAAVHNSRIAERGDTTAEGHRRMPVWMLTLPENAGLKKVCGRAYRFTQEPFRPREDVDALMMRLVELAKDTEVELIVLDDADNLAFHPKFTPFFKDFINQLGLTILMVGFGLRDRGPAAGPSTKGSEWVDQLGLRTFDVDIRRPEILKTTGEQEWKDLLTTIDADLRLVRAQSFLLDPLTREYLHMRCDGRVEPLMNVIRPACTRLLAAERKLRAAPENLTLDFLHKIPAPSSWQLKRAAAEKHISRIRAKKSPVAAV